MSAVTSKPAIACFHCKKDHDSATAFLLMCAKCQRAWHNGCHIPPVSSEELLKRYDADRAGKRAAGIRSWQCRTCTKRSRPEPSGSSIPSTVPTRCSDTPPARTTTQSQPAIAGQPLQAPSRTSAPIVIAIDDSDEDDDIIVLDGPPPQQDDDIIVLDGPPPQLPKPASTKPSGHTQGDSSTDKATSQAPSQAGGSRAIASAHRTTTPTTTRLSATPQPHSLEDEAHDHMSVDSDSTDDRPSVVTGALSAAASMQRKDKGKGRAQDLGRLPRELASTRCAVLPGQQAEAATEYNHPAPASSFFPSRTAPPPTAGPSEPLRAARLTRSPSPRPFPLSTQSRSQIRAEIVTIDQQGRRAGSPTIEFTDIPRAQGRPKPKSTPTKRTAIPVSASSDLDKDHHDAEAEDRMEVDPQLSAPEPVPQAEREGELEQEQREEDISQRHRQRDVADDDPYNIDDLYGDIGSRYLNEVPPPRVEPPPRVDPPPHIDPPALLLFGQRHKRRPRQDDLGLIIDKIVPSEGAQARRARKTAAKQLVGKDLKKKLEKGLVYFSADD